jgi:hypothetical protein
MRLFERNAPQTDNPSGPFNAAQMAQVSENVRRKHALNAEAAQRKIEAEQRKIQNERRSQIEALLTHSINAIDYKVQQAARLGHRALNITEILEEKLSDSVYSHDGVHHKFITDHDYAMSVAAEILNSYYSRRGFSVRYVYFKVTRYGTRYGTGNHGVDVTGYYEDTKNGVEISW